MANNKRTDRDNKTMVWLDKDITVAIIDYVEKETTIKLPKGKAIETFYKLTTNKK